MRLEQSVDSYTLDEYYNCLIKYQVDKAKGMLLHQAKSQQTQILRNAKELTNF